jgi:hypothetical protein
MCLPPWDPTQHSLASWWGVGGGGGGPIRTSEKKTWHSMDSVIRTKDTYDHSTSDTYEYKKPTWCFELPCTPPVLIAKSITLPLNVHGMWHTNVNCSHRKKRFTSFPSPAGMSLTKLPLGRNNSVMTSLFPPRESLVVTSRLGTGNSQSFFLRCTAQSSTISVGVYVDKRWL